MPAATRVVTANVLSTLRSPAAGRCLDAALAVAPDVVGLQEWRVGRLPLLARTGRVTLAGTPVALGRRASFTWVAAAPGDCVAGLRADRFVVRRHGLDRLGGLGPADPATRVPPVLPPRWATWVEADDLLSGLRVGVVVFHLVPGAQRRDRYHPGRPRTARRHREEVASLQDTVDRLLARTDVVWAMGDSNFHGLSLAGLVSAWTGRPGRDGTLGSHRRIDDVLSTLPAERVLLVPTESDHRMVVVDQPPAPVRVPSAAHP